MKMIVAIIKPFKLDDVRQALTDVGVNGLTVSEVKGYGRQKGHSEIYRGAEYEVAFVPKLRLEMAIADDMLEPTREALRQSAHTGDFGDGKVFEFDLEQALRIRTGEMGPEAL